MNSRPFALCCCGTPLVATLEVPYKEWYCVTCKLFYEYLHARQGDGPNPTDELNERYQAAEKKYDLVELFLLRNTDDSHKLHGL